MRQTQRFLAGPLLLTCVGLLDLACWPADLHGAATIDEVEIGFAGAHKMGYWTPLWVTLTAANGPVAGHLDILSLDGRGLDVRSLGQQSVSIAAGRTETFLRYVKIGRTDKALTVEFQPEVGPPRRRRVSYRDRPRAAPSNAELIVSLGADIGVAEALDRDATARNVRAVTVARADRLPRDWFGFEGVDAVVVTTFDNPLLDELDAAQTKALRQWIEMGGQLVFCLGAAGARFADLPDGSPLQPLAELVPGHIDSVATVGNTAALENYTGGGQALRIESDERFRMTVLDQVRGNLELFDIGVNGQRPMLIRAPAGFGEVVFVAFDLDQPPLAAWSGRARMVVKVMRGAAAEEQRFAAQERSGQVSHVGYQDLVGQLRGALDQFEGVTFVAFSVVATLVLLYIVLIGPVDFFFLDRVLGRRQLTWITFPLLVVVFVTLAVVLKQQLKGDRLLVNQVDVIDVDTSSGLVRGTTWAHIYSPATESYDVRVRPAVTLDGGTEPATLISWQGLPGSGLGGLSSTSVSSSLTAPYALDGGPSAPVISGLPIQVASSTAISARWWQHVAPTGPPHLRADVDGLLQGEVVNPFPVELHECMILYADWAYYLERTRGRLAPGQQARAEDERPRNLVWRLTRREVQEMKDVATPWDPASRDVPRIMEMMMLQEAAGGDQYTRLAHRYQDYIDLSAHLNRGRAILIGRVEARGSDVTVDDHVLGPEAGRHWTFCRAVFPVDRKHPQNE